MRKNARTPMRGVLRLIRGTAVGLALAGATLSAQAADPVKIGVLLPYTGTYAALGEAITNGMKLAIKQHGNQLGGREVEYVIVDGEANPSTAIPKTQQLIAGENVDFVIGPVHSGVGMAMVKVARDTGAILIIPNAGFGAATGPLCAPNIFRTSFTAWQTAYPMGEAAVERGYDEVVTLAWRYAFGQDSVAAFKEGFENAGGEIIEELWVPFPSVEFQPYLAQIANIKPDAVFVFFAGGGAVKFVKDYAAAGLKDSIPLTGSGFLTDGTLQAQGEAAEGVLTTLHYSLALENPVNEQFKADYKAAYGMPADIYAVQGYDTGLVLVQALEAAGGDTSDREALIQAMEDVVIESPRGEWRFSEAHNPIQNVYLREVRDSRNEVVGVAAEGLKDPARGCDM